MRSFWSLTQGIALVMGTPICPLVTEFAGSAVSRFVIVALGCVLSAAMAFGDVVTPAPPSPPDNSDKKQFNSPLPQVTVNSDRVLLKRRIHTFVTKISEYRFQQDSLARWHEPICFRVLGLPDEQAEHLSNRVFATARPLGITIAGKGCQPNFIALVTPMPNEPLEVWKRKGINGPFSYAWPAVLNDFLTNTRPARTWYDTEPVDSMGVVRDVFPSTFGPHLTAEGSNVISTFAPSFTTVIVVIDTSRATGIKLGAMADYVAMVGLAQINIDANMDGSPSILSLFDSPEGERPQELSTWDKAYLKGLYGTMQHSKLQRSLIASSMVKDIAP